MQYANDAEEASSQAVRTSGDYDLCICIVLYGKSAPYCKTIASLQRKSHLLVRARVKIVVWNNGPSSFSGASVESLRKQFPESISIDVLEDLNNTPLPSVYNSVLELVPCHRLCILDDDSDPDERFIVAVCSNDCADLIVPRIAVSGVQHGPVKLGKFMAAGRHQISRPCGFFAIGSGLAPSKALMDRVRKSFGHVFDDRYALYGVDTSFCMRVERLARSGAIEVQCIGNIEHELSRLDPGASRNEFRRRERGWDFGITLRYYFELRLVKPLLGVLLRGPVGGGSVSVLTMAKGYMRGIHPRAIAARARPICEDMKSE